MTYQLGTRVARVGKSPKVEAAEFRRDLWVKRLGGRRECHNEATVEFVWARSDGDGIALLQGWGLGSYRPLMFLMSRAMTKHRLFGRVLRLASGKTLMLMTGD